MHTYEGVVHTNDMKIIAHVDAEDEEIAKKEMINYMIKQGYIKI